MGGGNKFIDDAAVRFELAFVPLKGVKFNSSLYFRGDGGQGGRGASCPPAAIQSNN